MQETGRAYQIKPRSKTMIVPNIAIRMTPLLFRAGRGFSLPVEEGTEKLMLLSFFKSGCKFYTRIIIIIFDLLFQTIGSSYCISQNSL